MALIYVVSQIARGSTIMLCAFIKKEDAYAYKDSVKQNGDFLTVSSVALR